MSINICSDHYQEMSLYVKAHLPEEACGLLAGLNNVTTWVYPVENELHSPVRYRMEPSQQLNALLEIERKGWDLLAIFHSHPQGPDKPSETDILEFYYPETVSLIWYREEMDWACRAYRIQDGNVFNVEIDLT